MARVDIEAKHHVEEPRRHAEIDDEDERAREERGQRQVVTDQDDVTMAARVEAPPNPSPSVQYSISSTSSRRAISLAGSFVISFTDQGMHVIGRYVHSGPHTGGELQAQLVDVCRLAADEDAWGRARKRRRARK